MYNREKFKKLVHYVCLRCEDFSSLGAIKLNKILLYAERDYFLRTGSELTGETFVKRQFGPAPKHVVGVLSELQSEHCIVIKETIEFGKPKRRFINLVAEMDLSLFNSEELRTVDRIALNICLKHTAKSISDQTHDAIWDMAAMAEEIPLYTVFAIQGEVDEDDFTWAQGEVAQREALAA